MVQLKGVIPALTTPFRADQSLDVEGYRKLIEAVIVEDGVHGILAGGCTGEAWALDEAETLQVFETAVKQAAKRVPVVGGCGAMSIRQAIRQVKLAEKAGCDVAMIQAPWYVMPGMDEVMQYYTDIAAASRLPIMVYNNPRRTGIHMTPDFMDRLADNPKVIALKESSKDWLVLSEMIRRLKDRIAVLAGYSDYLGLAAIEEGAVGFVDGSPPVVGRDYTRFYEAATKGDRATAQPLQARFSSYGKALGAIGTFPAASKAALEFKGRPGGSTRDPIRPLNAEQRERVRRVMEEHGALPAEPARKRA